MVVGWGEGPGGNVDIQKDQVETWKPLEYYKRIIKDLRNNEEMDYWKGMIPSLMKSVDESTFDADKWEDDLIKRQLFDDIREEIQEHITDPTKTEWLLLARELQRDDNNIPEDADIAQVAEFMNNEQMESILNGFWSMDVSHILPEWADPVALQMYMSREVASLFEITNIQSVISTVSMDLIDSSEIGTKFSQEMLEAKENLTENIEGVWIVKAFEDYESNMKKIMDSSLWEWTFDQMKTKIWEISEDTVRLSKNLSVLKDTEDIDFSRTTVIDYIWDNINTELTEENKTEHIAELLKLSGDTSYDRDTALEKKVAEINKIFEWKWIDPEKAKGLMEGIKESGEKLSETIINLSNQWWLWALFAKLFQEWWPLAFLATLFWPEFQEAVSESNLKKQRALFNLVKIST